MTHLVGPALVLPPQHRIDKKALSLYIRSGCDRQLRLNLTPARRAKVPSPHRDRQGMPDKQDPRPGLAQIREEGERWQAEKVADLADTFPHGALVGTGGKRDEDDDDGTQYLTYGNQRLADALAQAAPDRFLVEAFFAIEPPLLRDMGVDAYRTRLGVTFADVRPDLIQVLAPRAAGPAGDPRGGWGVTPRGDRVRLADTDTRLRLRVVDIKLTSEPATNYFAEVAYYAIALAAWLEHHGRDGDFVVVADAAVWPGTHEGSLVRAVDLRAKRLGLAAALDALLEALEQELEPVPFDVFAQRLRRFFGDDVPRVLDEPDWRALPWFVDNRCKGCDYLGYSWKRNFAGSGPHVDALCYPNAKTADHLSRVPFLTRGSSATLTDSGVATVAALAGRGAHDAVFDEHQTLRAQRLVVAGRAESLKTGVTRTIAGAGTSAVMPRWADLRLYLSADFDSGSAITLAFAVKATWVRPFAGRAAGLLPATKQWPAAKFDLDEKDVGVEWRELKSFLTHIHDILTEARTLDPATTVQLYLWDDLQFDHMVRVMGRHLESLRKDKKLHYLAWLFPPEAVLPSASADRRAPVTLVRHAVRSLVQAPVPHYYSLLGLARDYHSTYYASHTNPTLKEFRVNPFFEDPLSDQIPSERAHAIWSRVGGKFPWGQQQDELRRTLGVRLDALSAVQQRLQDDLKSVLDADAPRVDELGVFTPEPGICLDGQLWVAFSKLNAALDALEIQSLYAMPPHEREARFKTARLTHRLVGGDEAAELAAAGLSHARNRRVYRLAEASCEFKAKEGDFTLALAPAAHQNFLLQKVWKLVPNGTALPPRVAAEEQRIRNGQMAWHTAVTLVHLDRERRVVVVDQSERARLTLDELEALGVDLTRDVMLEPTANDYFTKKLVAALKAVKNPPIAQARAHVSPSVGVETRARTSRQAVAPIADFLWDAPAMAAAPTTRVSRLPAIRRQLETNGVRLNPSQWQAWEQALGRRAAVIWGPPGTGKSKTARAVLAGAALDADARGEPLRVLVTGQTYKAFDNVLLGFYQQLGSTIPGVSVGVHRLRGEGRSDEGIPAVIDRPVVRCGDPHDPTQQAHWDALVDLRARLLAPRGRSASGGPDIVVVGGVHHQVHHLMTVVTDPNAAGAGVAQQPFFDLVLIDEASQMDVGQAIVALTALAPGGSVVLVGDDKQLPPIHAAEAPTGYESLVGSVYSFARERHGLAPVMLDENYRSNAEIVEFARDHAGYQATLHSAKPGLRLNLVSPVPTGTTAPPNWPAHLAWSPEYAALLDPDVPVSCFVYADGRSSQANAFEADVTASLVRVLGDTLGAELHYKEAGVRGGPALYAAEEFWTEGVGIVTPHKAQQSLVTRRLMRAFPAVNPAWIRGAVDTVERFQGGERDVIIATYALGDPDAIGLEEEFLLGFNRFNVAASRPRAKLIALISQEVADHLCADLDALRGSALLKAYVDSYCHLSRPMTLPFLRNGVVHHRAGAFRWR